MNVLLLSPGYPADVPQFVRGLAEVGARVYGIGDQPAASLPGSVRPALAGYVQVRSLWDFDQVASTVSRELRGLDVSRVECLWEPGIDMAARLREAFGVPGLSVEAARRFRDKELMKQALDAAGIRTPHHRLAESVDDCLKAAEELGFPLILKPIAGAGSADTYRVDDAEQLRAVLPMMRHVPRVSVEEFVDGEEYTFDAVSIDGEVAYFNVAWYRPRPLIARSNEWISPQVIALRDVDEPSLADGIAMGHDVLKALDFGTGFTHMEWYRKADGEVVFGEIGARPPGAHQVEQMNFACDFDVGAEWGRAVAHGAFEATIKRRFNVATVYKRAQGAGTIRRIEGLREFHSECGDHIVWNALLNPGQRRRDWRQTLVSDGFLMLRHPELERTLEMADQAGSQVQLIAS
ncbi:MAG: ATP-grasp domain-containing protein [Pseudomonadota bacterium]